jgi:hypothetical protein
MLEASQIETKDWDDMIDKTEVFGEKSYANDSPDGYDSIVDEVVKDQDAAIQAKKDAQIKEEKAKKEKMV